MIEIIAKTCQSRMRQMIDDKYPIGVINAWIGKIRRRPACRHGASAGAT